MSAFRGILTGYLGAKIADTEAADRLKGEVLASASKDLLTNILPEQRAAEELRRKNYNNLASMYNPNIAELADINDFTRDEASMEKFENFLEKNKLKDPEAFKNLQFETDFNTRYDQRGIAFNEKFQPLLKQIGIDQQGGMGFYTIKNQLSEPGQTDQTMEQPGQTPEAPQEFASTQLSDYFVPKPDEEFGEGSQYRLRLNDIQKQAVTATGLNAKFITNPDGSTTVTDIDEASQNKFQLVTEYSSDMFAKTPNRTDYINIGNEAATRVTALESLAKNGNNAMTNYFQSHIQKAPKVDGKVDYTSEEKVYPLKDGTMVNAREVFERQNADLIKAYIVGSITQKNFIREKFGRGYSVFFDQIDDALDQQENS